MSTKLTPTSDTKTCQKSDTKPDTRTALVQAGMEIMLEQGYSNTSIHDVLSSLSVPKGSFYHYFESKEAFAVAIIHYCDQSWTAALLKTLENPEETPLQRLRSYCQVGKEDFLSGQCRRGCLIGNLSQEMSDQSETLRKELSAIMSKRRGLFASCIQEAQTLGEISTVFDAAALADVFDSGWSGAVMRAKTVKTTEPMEIFIELMFDNFLQVGK